MIKESWKKEQTKNYLSSAENFENETIQRNKERLEQEELKFESINDDVSLRINEKIFISILWRGCQNCPASEILWQPSTK